MKSKCPHCSNGPLDEASFLEKRGDDLLFKNQACTCKNPDCPCNGD